MYVTALYTSTFLTANSPLNPIDKVSALFPFKFHYKIMFHLKHGM
jgi:hypothetical protein